MFFSIYSYCQGVPFLKGTNDWTKLDEIENAKTRATTPNRYCCWVNIKWCSNLSNKMYFWQLWALPAKFMNRSKSNNCNTDFVPSWCWDKEREGERDKGEQEEGKGDEPLMTNKLTDCFQTGAKDWKINNTYVESMENLHHLLYKYRLVKQAWLNLFIPTEALLASGQSVRLKSEMKRENLWKQCGTFTESDNQHSTHAHRTKEKIIWTRDTWPINAGIKKYTCAVLL